MKRLVLCAISAALIFAPAPVAQAAGAPDGTTISISTSGDLLTHSPLYNGAKKGSTYNFDGMLAGLKPLLTADINICHLETVLMKGTPKGYPMFRTPPSLATTIKKVGFDGCSVVSNHTLDQGIDGTFSTKRTMMAAGLKTAGTRLTENDIAIAWYKVKGVDVAQLAYTFSFNGLTRPKGKEWVANLIDAKAIIAAAKAARQAGAQLVIVSLHWGVEYSDTASSSQKNLAQRLTASSYIDGIIGHHTHVIQYATVMNGKPVIYGTGNLWSAQGPWKNMKYGQHGAIVTLNFKVKGVRSEFTGGSYVPTLTQRYSWKVGAAQSVTISSQKTEACNAIKNAAKHFSAVLSGPTHC